MHEGESTRREFLGSAAALAAGLALAPSRVLAQAASVVTRKIPSSGVELPVVGLGTWITFNVGKDAKSRDARAEVMKEFFEQGGALIDSSPMYGSSEEVVGHGLAKLGAPKALFAATKVWTSSKTEGVEQIEDSQRLWGVKVFDLLQIHNLVGWEEHLATLLAMKASGQVRHVGITTSHGRRHDDLEKIMRAHPIDFVQLTYNVVEREPEKRLLPLARERKIAVIANRPYEGGELIDRVKKKPLPPWAAEIGCSDWPTFLLKFIVAHPAVTCAIPATSRVAHLRENMRAAQGAMPDEAARERMAKYVASL